VEHRALAVLVWDSRLTEELRRATRASEQYLYGGLADLQWTCQFLALWAIRASLASFRIA
jgi:hypothetical protein